ncbi:MAG: tetratricopeptide repeat-containing serine protease family protein [Bacteroidales bacterium]|nr:tetratricopeptide repeat-containing serine protease family protein [Bacteroidales bacterium]
MFPIYNDTLKGPIRQVLSKPNLRTNASNNTANTLQTSLLAALLLFFSTSNSSAQLNLVQLIDKTEAATFSLLAYNSRGISTDTARAFFISGDGLAITSASIFQKADTLIVSGHKNRNLYLSRVIAIHPMANLAMIQLSGFKNREDNYLSPARQPFEAPAEVMTFPHASDHNNSLNIAETRQIIHPFLLGRSAILSISYTNASRGAPIINASGQFIGVLHFLPFTAQAIMLPVYLINDDQWTSVNQSWVDFNANPSKPGLAAQFCADALLVQAQEKWIESARLFTSAFRLTPDNARLYALRSISRHQYGNRIGAEEDFNRALQLDEHCGLAYYGRAVYHIKNNQNNLAIGDLLTCLQKEGDLASGFVLLGQLQNLNKEVRKAHASYTFAIQLDTLLAEGWYERGRLSMQYASDHTSALEDLTTASRLNPYLPGVFTLIGNIKFNRNDYLEAITEFNRALRMNPNDDHALMNRGISYFNTGLKERACEDWGDAGKLGNTQAFRLISRHCSQLKRGSFSSNSR